MDAVAVLFTTEIDNVVNGFALSEHVHSRVKAAGRLELTAGEAAGMCVRTSRPCHEPVLESRP
jgi:hypothetical protein